MTVTNQDALVVYTTIYPGVEPFLQPWYRSVRAQTDRAFELWIALDGLEPSAVVDILGDDPGARWVTGIAGDTPATIRQRAFELLLDRCEAVVLVDSDDVLHPSRVASARVALQSSDLVGCALRLVDQHGTDLGQMFGLPPATDPNDVLPRNNVFGLSNSAIRTSLLRRCLPIPPSAMLVDWYLVTRAWLRGAALTFDREARMDYRQHGNNMARVRAPFHASQIARDTERVRHHFDLVRVSQLFEVQTRRLRELEAVAADVDEFYQQVVLRPTALDEYVRALNAANPEPLWWSSVANPSLRRMWTH